MHILMYLNLVNLNFLSTDLMDNLVRGLASQKGEKHDNIFSEDITNHLFEESTIEGIQRHLQVPGLFLPIILNEAIHFSFFGYHT